MIHDAGSMMHEGKSEIRNFEPRCKRRETQNRRGNPLWLPNDIRAGTGACTYEFFTETSILHHVSCILHQQ